jgi:hypothetical protein
MLARIIREDQFDLTPVLEAARAHNPQLMNDIFAQGYIYSWHDHLAHKTLMAVLGEEFDLETIQFLQTLDKNISISDAAMGAAYAGKSLTRFTICHHQPCGFFLADVYPAKYW